MDQSEAPTVAAGPAGPKRRRVRQQCSHCGRLIVQTTLRGYTLRCPHCGTVNAGPGLIAEQSKPRDAGSRERVTERDRRARRRRQGEEKPAAAPVRRRRTAPATPAAEPEPTPAAGAPAPAPAPVRRGLLERVFYGEGE
jgi:ribosomal protein L37AE/L43A